MKHTLGPWEVGKTRTNKITIIANGKNIFLGNHYGNEEANAKLISAAPDLLEACKYVVKWHREHDSGEGELYGLDFVTTCINVIEKAEGR